MRAQVYELSREAQRIGKVLLKDLGAVSPPDDIALAHARFLACLQARVADAGRVGRLVRGEALTVPASPPACQMFSSAEVEVQAYVGSP